MLENIYKTKQKRGYINRDFLVVDNSAKSPNYFNILEVPQTLTAGKNIVKLGCDGLYLKRNYDIDIEVLDVNGDPLYTEFTGFVDRYGYSYFIVYVYDITPIGVGSLSFVGVANRDLSGKPLTYGGSEHTNEYTVLWSTDILIKSTDRNLTDIVFQKAPEVQVTQVLTPYKFNFGTYALNSRLASQSLDNVLVYTSENSGFDFIQNYSENIQDALGVENSYNYFIDASTANTVKTNIRRYDNDIQNGFVFSEYSRYNTVIYDAQGRLSKDMEGSIFSFANNDNGVSIRNTWNYKPALTSTYDPTPSGSFTDQIVSYKSKIVYVLNKYYAYLDKAPSVSVIDYSDPSVPVTRDYTFKILENTTGSFLYPTSSLQEVQSINLSSSYIQFTFFDLQPIAGDIYRIKTFAKEAGRNAEYYQLNDHIVKAPEFLIDTDKTNQSVYAKNKSDFFTYGEFTTQSIVVDYWRGFVVEQNELYQYSLSPSSSAIYTNTVLANALTLTSTTTAKRGIATRYYQTYIPDQPYSLSFYCSLDPGCELEVYMSSTPLKDTVLGLQAPRAFTQTRERGTNESYNKFGKYLGKISNINGNSIRHYENVVFDFLPDADGFGRPVLFLTTDSATNKNAYISSLSITPLELTGFTPSILQFAAATPDSINILQDDDASLTQSLDLKIEYFTADGRQSEYTTFIPNVQINMINEVPGFCSSEANKFNDHCPFYWEVVSSSLQVDVGLTTKANSGTASLDPTQYIDHYFWPTFSLNFAGGYHWNIRGFAISGTSYNSLVYTRPVSSSITSSWFRYDPFLPLYTQAIPGGVQAATMYSGTVAPVTYSATPIDGLYTSTLSTDRKFYDGNGAAISRYELAYSQSLLISSNSVVILNDAPKLETLQTYLRKSRLYFPSTSSNYPYGFYENGGIYNVRFKISSTPLIRYSNSPKANYIYSNDGSAITAATEVGNYSKTVNSDSIYTPEDGAKLMVYIADVATPISNQLDFVRGRAGLFPPKNNIVTIGNGYGITPTIRFFDSGSGYNVDQYDLVLVQYGEKAQLVFDASGLEFEPNTDPTYLPNSYMIYNNTDQAFWGGIISDIEWCKIGVTTDPRFIKPVNFDDAFNTFTPTNPPPFPAPPSNPFEAEDVGDVVFD